MSTESNEKNKKEKKELRVEERKGFSLEKEKESNSGNAMMNGWSLSIIRLQVQASNSHLFCRFSLFSLSLISSSLSLSFLALLCTFTDLVYLCVWALLAEILLMTRIENILPCRPSEYEYTFCFHRILNNT